MKSSYPTFLGKEEDLLSLKMNLTEDIECIVRSLVSSMSPFDLLLRKEISSSVNGTFLYSIIGRADNHEQKLEPRDRGDREICESLETIRLPFKEYVVFRKRVNPEPSKVLKRWTLPPEKAKKYLS